MTQTVFGELLTADGAATTRVLVQGPTRPELRRRFWASPAAELRSVQAERVAIDLNHDGQARGELVYLERRHGRVFAVGHVDDGVTATVHVRLGPDNVVTLDEPRYWSASRFATPDHRDLILESVALVPSTARVCGQPVTILPGALDHADAWRRWNLPGGYQRDLLERAAHAHRDRRFGGGPLIVHDVGPNTRAALPDTPAPRPVLEYRSAIPVDTSPSRRTIDLIVMPYDKPALVLHEGRAISEIVDRSAFDGIEETTRRVRVNRDHDRSRTVGRAIGFNPHHPDGLYAELKIARTPLGDETLALADELVLDASAGFAVLPGGEHWESNRSRRRLTKLHLDHIALTPDPAYADARVLAVRGAASI